MRKFLFVLIAFIMAACQQPDGDKDIEINLDYETPVVGETVLRVTLRDDNGEPVNNADVEVSGVVDDDVPVLGSAASGSNGVYEVPFNWTTAGDWVVTVTASLDDDQTVSQNFTVNAVTGTTTGISLDLPPMQDPEDCETTEEAREDEEECALPGE